MKIAIAGYGIEGQQNYSYWSADSANDITIVDERTSLEHPVPEGAKTLLGEGVFGQLDGFDLVVRTAGLAPHKIHTTGRVWSATNEFFAQCPAPIIGVTGSKGKGTTASLISAILQAAGKKVWLVGNIGVPALSVLPEVEPDDIVVYELSSFQLWDIQRSPHTAVVLYIEQDHLDVHRSMEEYVEAKAQITRHQSADDLLIYNSENHHAAFIARDSLASKVAIPSSDHAHIADGYFCYGERRICPVERLAIRGAHNQANALAAIDAVWQYTQSGDAIEAGIHGFKGLPHRLSYVTTVRGVDYYDDSIATTPTAAIAALRAFPEQQKVLILGGSSKGADYTKLGQELTKHDVTALLVGDEAARIQAACDAAQFTQYEVLSADATATEFTHRASELVRSGGVVLLSPAAASFGQFKNYADRGDQFVAAVKALPV